MDAPDWKVIPPTPVAVGVANGLNPSQPETIVIAPPAMVFLLMVTFPLARNPKFEPTFTGSPIARCDRHPPQLVVISTDPPYGAAMPAMPATLPIESVAPFAVTFLKPKLRLVCVASPINADNVDMVFDAVLSDTLPSELMERLVSVMLPGADWVMSPPDWMNWRAGHGWA